MVLEKAQHKRPKKASQEMTATGATAISIPALPEVHVETNIKPPFPARESSSLSLSVYGMQIT